MIPNGSACAPNANLVLSLFEIVRKNKGIAPNRQFKTCTPRCRQSILSEMVIVQEVNANTKQEDQCRILSSIHCGSAKAGRVI
jgi:hypothetical protein